MTLSAMQASMMPDRRRLRAQVVSHYALHALEPWIERLEQLEEWVERERMAAGEPEVRRPRSRRDIAEALFDLFFAIGAEVITDADRAEAGLDPRNERGLTMHELHAMEDRLMAAMRTPVHVIVDPLNPP